MSPGAFSVAALSVAPRLCPDCLPGRQARALILADEPVRNLLILIAPFLALALVVIALHFAIESIDRRPDAPSSRDRQ